MHIARLAITLLCLIVFSVLMEGTGRAYAAPHEAVLRNGGSGGTRLARILLATRREEDERIRIREMLRRKMPVPRP
jgi:hypothetical protein